MFKGKILVIGDVMLDRYVRGDVNRISPEAPVPVLESQEISYNLGGAGNVANNLSALGVESILIGVVGEDNGFRELQKLIESVQIESGLIVDAGRPTTIKERYISGGHQLLRVDYESKQKVGKKVNDELFKALQKAVPLVDAIIVSDYNKGLFSEELARYLVHKCRAEYKPLLVDTKPINAKYFSGCTLFKPNRKEAEELTGIPSDGLEFAVEACKVMSKNLDSDILLTRGSQGMILYQKDGNYESFSAHAKEVFDVSGAGDTVIATLAAGLTSGMGLRKACDVANYAASIVVRKLGTATVKPEELEKQFGVSL